MPTAPDSDDLEQLRAEQGFDAYAKELARRQGESAAQAIFDTRTPDELMSMTEQNRRHLEQWRSTPKGEADYQALCARVLASGVTSPDDNPARATG